MAEPEINALVIHLAIDEKASASARAFSAILFLYRHVLHREFGDLGGLVRAQVRAPARLSARQGGPKLGGTRQSIMKDWIAEKLERQPQAS
jgi:hypothetical protein